MATGVARRAWIMAAEASGSRAQVVSRSKHNEKAAGTPRLFRSCQRCRWPGNTPPVCWTSRGPFAKRRPLAKTFRAGSGRIAQLVEQLTLNQRVPGSSPGAPTKLFKDLGDQTLAKRSRVLQLIL